MKNFLKTLLLSAILLVPTTALAVPETVPMYRETSNNVYYIWPVGSISRAQVVYGSTTPLAQLTVTASSSLATTQLFAVASSTGTRLFNVLGNGNVGVGTTTPGTLFSLGNTGAATSNFSVTSTSSLATGLNLKTGCITYNGGACLGTGGGSSIDVGTGIVTQTGSGTFAGRTITTTGLNGLSVTNGNGVSGNPVINISNLYEGQASIITLGTIATGVWNANTIMVPYGGTGASSFGQGWIHTAGGTSNFTSSTTPWVNAITATSTTEASIFGTGGIAIATTSPTGLFSINNLGTRPSIFVSDATDPDSTPFILDASGNLGVGTTTPTQKIVAANPTGTAGVVVDDGVGSAAILQAGAANSKFMFDQNFDFEVAANSRANVLSGNGSGRTVRIYVDGSSGNVGINTGATDPGFGVALGGTVAMTGLSSSATGNAVCIDAGTSEILNSGAAACTPSSIQFKENVSNLSSDKSIATLLKLRPVEFDYKNKQAHETNHSYGLIAEEVEAVDKNLVDYDKKGGVFGLHFEKITGLLVSSVQNVIARVSGLEKKVEEQDKRIAELERIINERK